MVYRDKKGIIKYSIFCVTWAAVTGLLGSVENSGTDFWEYCSVYWRGFSGFGTDLFWWILIQFPVYGGSIFYYQKWRMYSRYILLKKGIMKAEKFFILQMIKMTGIYYSLHFSVMCLIWFAENAGQTPESAFGGFTEGVMLYVLLFLNGLAFILLETALYVIIRNEYFSFVLVLFVHILVNFFAANADSLPFFLWTVCANLAVCDGMGWQSFVSGAVWSVALSGCLPAVISGRRENFWG